METQCNGTGSAILLVSGEGYSTTWPGGGFDDRVTVEWQEGTIFVPPIYWYHQHLNPGSVPARYMAMNAPLLVAALGLRFEDQIELDKEEIREDFETRVKANREKEDTND